MLGNRKITWINSAKVALHNSSLFSLIIFQAWSSRNFCVRPLTVPLGPQMANSSLVLIPKTEESSEKVNPSSNLGKGLYSLINGLRSLSISSKFGDS